jgi:hypothetical protein
MALDQQREVQAENLVGKEQLEHESTLHQQGEVGRSPAILREEMEVQKEPGTQEQKKLP